MHVKNISLELSLTEFEALLHHLTGRCTNRDLVSIFRKMQAIQERLDVARKMSEKFPIREG